MIPVLSIQVVYSGLEVNCLKNSMSCSTVPTLHLDISRLIVSPSTEPVNMAKSLKSTASFLQWIIKKFS